MITYQDFKQQQTKELNDFMTTNNNVVWAFSNKQFSELLQNLKMNLDEFKKSYKSFYGGGFIKKDCIKDYNELVEKQANEMQEKHNDFEFMYSAFRYEMNNYECFYSMDFDEPLKALNVTNEIKTNKTMQDAFSKAKKDYWDKCIENDY